MLARKKVHPVNQNVPVVYNGYTVEKNIPIPEHRPGPPGVRRYPLHLMGVGDSFFIELPENANSVTVSRLYGRVVHEATKLSTPDRQFKVAGRKVDGGMRFWRVV